MDSIENTREEGNVEVKKAEEVVGQVEHVDTDVHVQVEQQQTVPAQGTDNVSTVEPTAVAESPVTPSPAETESIVDDETEATVEEQPAEVEENADVPQQEVVQSQSDASESETEDTSHEAEEDGAAQKQARPVHHNYTTKAEVIERMKQIASSEETPDKEEVDQLKTTFYKLHIAEREAEQRAYLEQGGDPEKYQAMPDDDEEVFKAELGVIKEKRAKQFQVLEEEKQENLKKKLDIIEKIKNMATSPEEANKSYNAFKELQQQWKDIKPVPADKVNELWRNYQLYVEQFYDLLKLNNEAREYDFRKNLELKTKLCEAAEKLAEEPDVISAFHQLQELHQQYREIGPVAKDLREQVWARFKAASTVINKRHQQHFEDLRAREEQNLAAKTELCERVEAIAKNDAIKTAAEWDKFTKEIIDIQAKWKTIGYAPQKMNVKIFERFRKACDEFFGRKSAHFKQLRETYAVNIAKKKELVAQAKELQDSTDWKSTGDKLIALQKEWKAVGLVPRKTGEQLWKEFLGACNKFFEARNAATTGSRNEERTNLETKRNIIKQLKDMLENAAEDAQERVQALVNEYESTGHVPFREKDKLYKEYHDVLDQLSKQFGVNVTRRHLNDFKNNLKNIAKRGEDALDNERSRLMRRYDQLKSEIQTYENNLGFLNASSKKGNNLIEEMNRKVQKLKDDCTLVREKIKAIDAEDKEGTDNTGEA